jgi:hypothetical protein
MAGIGFLAMMVLDPAEQNRPVIVMVAARPPSTSSADFGTASVDNQPAQANNEEVLSSRGNMPAICHGFRLS